MRDQAAISSRDQGRRFFLPFPFYFLFCFACFDGFFSVVSLVSAVSCRCFGFYMPKMTTKHVEPGIK